MNEVTSKFPAPIHRRQALWMSGMASGCVSGMLTRVAKANARATLDGRVSLGEQSLTYRVYGPADGTPVLYFHGMPGSRLEPGLIEGEVWSSGIRLISLNRPGIGESSRCGKSGRAVCRMCVTCWPRMVCRVANCLGIGKFGIVGVSGGAPFALACAARIASRLHRVAVVSGHGPMKRGLDRGNQDLLVQLVGSCQGLGGAALSIIRRKLQRDPQAAMKSLAKSWTDADRQLVFGNFENREKFRRNLVEAFCQPKGLADDIQLLAKPWGFCVQEASCSEVGFWAGCRDELVPPHHSRWMHQQVRRSRLVVDPCTSHVTTVHRFAAEYLTFAAGR